MAIACPMGLDATPATCSAGTCRHCRAVRRVRARIAEVQRWRAEARERRDRPGMSDHDRAGAGIEAAAAALRLRGLMDALRAMEADDGAMG
jgi:hypothetical protein